MEQNGRLTGNDSLQSLSDTSFTSFKPTDVPQYLVWDGISWLPSKLNLRLGDLSDVNGGGVNGQVLTIQNGAWSAKTLSGLTVDNWKSTEQMITAGNSANDNLQAHDDIRWDGTYLMISNIADDQAAVIKLNAKSGKANSDYALLGFNSGSGGKYTVNAAIRVRNPEVRDHMLGSETNEMVFETTRIGDSSKSPALSINRHGGIVTKPVSLGEDHPHTSLHVNGSLGQNADLISSNSSVQDSHGFVMIDTSSATVTYNLGNPTSSSEGRVVHVRRVGIYNVSISGNLYVDVNSATSLTLNNPRPKASFICAE